MKRYRWMALMGGLVAASVVALIWLWTVPILHDIDAARLIITLGILIVAGGFAFALALWDALRRLAQVVAENPTQLNPDELRRVARQAGLAAARETQTLTLTGGQS